MSAKPVEQSAAPTDRALLKGLSQKTRELVDALDTYADATDAELRLLRAIAEAAGNEIAKRGPVQTRTPLHHALAAWHRHLAEHAPKP